MQRCAAVKSARSVSIIRLVIGGGSHVCMYVRDIWVHRGPLRMKMIPIISYPELSRPFPKPSGGRHARRGFPIIAHPCSSTP